MPCHPARARELLRKERAVVARQVPFTIRLKDRTLADSEVDGVQLRVDPGSKGTGLHLTDEKKEANDQGATVTVRRGLISVELQHRGNQISMCMQQRAGYRRRRRSANCRYRAPRYSNRTHPTGWLPPSLRHRVDTALSQATRMCRYAPVTEIHMENVSFDTHAMSAGRPLYGAEYTQGPLAGTTVRAFMKAGTRSYGFPRRCSSPRPPDAAPTPRTTPDRYGFPRLLRARAKQHFGYITGDLVRATMPSGKWAGTWTGRISVRARGQHSLTTRAGRINVSHWNLRLLQRGEGYGYTVRPEAAPPISPKIA